MSWIAANLPLLGQLTLLHLAQAILPLILGFLLALPLARLALGRRQGQGRKSRGLALRRGLIVNGVGLLYVIPSLALFVLMPLILGTSITSPLNVYVALTLYVLAMMVRSCLDAFQSLPDPAGRPGPGLHPAAGLLAGGAAPEPAAADCRFAGGPGG